MLQGQPLRSIVGPSLPGSGLHGRPCRPASARLWTHRFAGSPRTSNVARAAPTRCRHTCRRIRWGPGRVASRRSWPLLWRQPSYW